MAYRITGPASIAGLATFTGAGEPNFSTASLDLQFARYRSLTDFVSKQNLVTFTRASSGTYVGSDGLIKRATTNLLLRSEEFDNASWTRDTLQTVTANDAVAPNGTQTADLITGTGTNNYLAQLYSVTSGVTYTFSVWIKSAGLGNDQFRLLGSNAQLSTTYTATAQWVRYSFTFTASSTSSQSIGVTRNASNNVFSLHLWGAQLEESSTVGEYVKTTSTINSAPRFDHNPTTGESLGLLVEENRTNLLLRSEEFDNASWIKFRSSVTANAIASPSGTASADKFVEDTSSSTNHGLYQSATIASGTSYTYTVFAKSAERTWLIIGYDIGAGERKTWFNLSTGAVATNANTTATITALSNGWYRCSVTGTSSATSATVVLKLATQDNNENYTGDGTSGIYLWGAQLEAGSFPTSYIPTTTAAVTRSADVASITGTNFSSWYRQDEGTFYGSVNPPKGIVLFGVGDTFDNTMYATSGAANNVTVRSAGSDQAALSAPVSGTTITNVAIGLQLNNFAACSNGGTLSTDTAGSVPASQVRLKIGSSSWDTSGGNNLNGTIRRLTYWPKRLSNSTLQTITQ